MNNDYLDRVAFDLFCDDVNNLLQAQGDCGWHDRDASTSNPAFDAFIEAETPQEFVLERANWPFTID